MQSIQQSSKTTYEITLPFQQEDQSLKGNIHLILFQSFAKENRSTQCTTPFMQFTVSFLVFKSMAQMFPLQLNWIRFLKKLKVIVFMNFRLGMIHSHPIIYILLLSVFVGE
jgi:hypothetical protein